MAKSVFLSGMSGLIGKEIAIELLKRGYTVHGSMRFGENESVLRSVITDELGSADLPLTIHKLELDYPSGWAKAMRDTSVLIHAAAPLIAAAPVNPNEVIKPAVDGTKTILSAAKNVGIEKMIMTSSVTAMTEGVKFRGAKTFDENDWSDLSGRQMTAYARAKTITEKMAWEAASQTDCPFTLTALLPGVTLGRLRQRKKGGSVAIINRLLKQLDPALPNFGFTYVNLRDVARMHVDAIDDERTNGQRIAIVNGFLWHSEIADILIRNFPDLELSYRQMPSFLARLAVPIRPRLRSIQPHLNRHADVSNAKAVSIFGDDLVPLEQTIVETAKSILEIDENK